MRHGLQCLRTQARWPAGPLAAARRRRPLSSRLEAPLPAMPRLPRPQLPLLPSPQVCDNGTGWVKCGFAGDGFPQTFPCMLGRPLEGGVARGSGDGGPGPPSGIPFKVGETSTCSI